MRGLVEKEAVLIPTKNILSPRKETVIAKKNLHIAKAVAKNPMRMEGASGPPSTSSASAAMLRGGDGHSGCSSVSSELDSGGVGAGVLGTSMTASVSAHLSASDEVDAGVAFKPIKPKGIREGLKKNPEMNSESRPPLSAVDHA